MQKRYWTSNNVSIFFEIRTLQQFPFQIAQQSTPRLQHYLIHTRADPFAKKKLLGSKPFKSNVLHPGRICTKDFRLVAVMRIVCLYELQIFVAVVGTSGPSVRDACHLRGNRLGGLPCLRRGMITLICTYLLIQEMQ